jgi:hypothetical protein
MLDKFQKNLATAPNLLAVFAVLLLAAYLLRIVMEPSWISGVRVVVCIWLLWHLLDRSKIVRMLMIVLSIFFVLTTWIFTTNLPILFSQTLLFAALATYLLFSKKYKSWLQGIEAAVKD